MTEKTYDNQYQILLKGYDVSMTPNQEVPGYYTVTLKENGTEVFEQDLPNASQDDGEVEEEVLNDIAQAAIDMFESDRGTLGLGAGAEPSNSKKARKAMKAKYMKRKQSYLACCEDHDAWYMNLKNTPYEQQAYDLLSQYIDSEYSSGREGSTVDDLYIQLNEVEYQMKKLDLERMRSMPVATQIIVIQGKKDSKTSSLWEVELIQDYLDKFCASPMEAEAVRLAKQYIELKEEINTALDLEDDSWSKMQEIEQQMEALSLESLYSNVIDKVPTEGLEAFPQMGADLSELMQGVSMDSPLIPTAPGEVLARKKALNEDVEPVEDRIIDKGEYHGGLDEAEAEYPETASWNNGDKVQLKKEIEVPSWAGKRKYPAGTKGTVDDLYEKSSLTYLVALEDKNGKITLAKVPGKNLKKRSK